MQIHSQAVYVNISPDLPNAADFPKAVEEIVESLGKWSNLKPFFQIGLVQAPNSWKTFGKVWNYGAYRIEGNIWFDQNSHPSGDLRNPHLVQTEGNLFFTLSSDNPWPKSTGLVMSCVCVCFWEIWKKHLVFWMNLDDLFETKHLWSFCERKPIGSE